MTQFMMKSHEAMMEDETQRDMRDLVRQRLLAQVEDTNLKSDVKAEHVFRR